MKNIILFFGSFDPIHLGHLAIIESAIKKVNADCVYIGLNKSSSKGKLSSLKHRKNMLKLLTTKDSKLKILPFNFDYTNLDKTYNNIFSITNDFNNYYILIGQDQLNTLRHWYKYDLLITKFKFIIAKRGNSTISDEELNNPNYIFIDHNYKMASSSEIKQNEYNNTNNLIRNYIIENNLYLKKQIQTYLDNERYLHTISVSKTAILINKKAKLGLDYHQVEKAALLHDIAKNLSLENTNMLIKKYYSEYLNEDSKILHQYLGAYLAKEKFYINDNNVLNAIKYHTTGRANMSTLEKLIFVADKIEPRRQYNTRPLLEACINDFEKGFILVLKRNYQFLKDKGINLTNIDSINCYKYYL